MVWLSVGKENGGQVAVARGASGVGKKVEVGLLKCITVGW